MTQHEFTGDGPICEECYLPRAAHNQAAVLVEEPELVQETNEPEDLVQAAIQRTVEDGPRCPGHVCEICGKEYTHNFHCIGQCGPRQKCAACIADIAAGINRVDNLIQNEDHVFTNAEEVQIGFEHEGVVYNMVYDENNNLRPNWQDTLQRHILGLKQVVRRCQV